MQPAFVHALFEAAAAAHPDRVAIELPDRAISYAALRARSLAVASRLAREGVSAGSRVAVLATDRSALVAAMLGALHVGCAFVPLDPALPDARLRQHLDAADCACALTEPSLTSRAVACGARPVLLDDESATEAPAPAQWEPDGHCYLYFTSGSTGMPRAIAGRLCAIDHFIRWEAAFLASDAPLRVSQLASPSFDASLRDLFLPLCTGGTLCVPPPGASTDAARFLAWLTDARVSVLHCVPSVFRVLLDAGLAPDSLPDLRHVLLAGEVLRTDDARRWFDAVGARVRLVNLYGPSETTMVKLFHVVTPDDLAESSIPVGRPMEGAELLLLGDDGAPVSPGAIGEIGIRTRYRALGYFRQPELTARAFLSDDLYMTGDHGRLSARGELLYLGRRDRQVKLSGVRVELDEIELALRRCASVIDAAAEVRAIGDGPAALLAWVTLRAPATAASVERELAKALPAAMLPSALTVVDVMPRTMSGKLDRRALPDPRVTRRAYTPPRTAVERDLASLWRPLLGAPEVSRHDSFFALGGNSLLAAQLVARVRAFFGVELSLARVLEEPTLAELSAAIESQQRARGDAELPSLAPIPRLGDGPKPLSFSQTTMWTMDRLIGPTGALNLYVGHRIRGALDVDALRGAVVALHARHSTLRTRFCIEDGQLVQRVDPSLAAPWEHVDLRALDEITRAAQLESRTRALLGATLLGPSPAPAYTATLLTLSDHEAHLVVVMHHIISDGASLAILCHELGALCAGRALPPLAVEYADHAAWLREEISGETLRALLAHETARLGGRAEYLELPVDRPQSLIPDLAGARAEITLPPELLTSLSALGRRASATLFMVLQAAWQLVLGAVCGARRVLVPTPVAARPRPELEGLIGMFMNAVVIGADTAGDPTFREFLGRVRRDAIDALDHQALPFELLTEALPAGMGSRHPLVQVMFNLQNMGSFDLALPGVAVDRLPLDSGSATFDLGLTLDEGPDGIVVTARYATSLFDAATVHGLLAAYRALLHSVATAPDTRLSALPLPPKKPAAKARFAAALPPSPRLTSAAAPIFFVPSPGGAAYHRALSERLAHPAVTLSAEAASAPLPERAASLAREALRSQPDGPWALAAWSLGAPLALEIAHQLRQATDAPVLVALFDAPKCAVVGDVEVCASRQLAHLALHRVWDALPGAHGDEITARVDAALGAIAAGSAPAALAALWRVTRFALGAPDASMPDEDDVVTLSTMGNVFGRQLGLIAPGAPSMAQDPSALFDVAVGAAKWLGAIGPDDGQSALEARVMTFRDELAALRAAGPSPIAPGVEIVRFTAQGGHFGMLCAPFVAPLAERLDRCLATHFHEAR